MGGEQKQVAIGALEGALWGQEQTCSGDRARSRRTSHMGLSLGNSGLKKVAGQGTRGEQRQGRKESNRSLCPRWREGSRVQFQIKQTGGGRRAQDAASPGPLDARGAAR